MKHKNLIEILIFIFISMFMMSCTKTPTPTFSGYVRANLGTGGCCTGENWLLNGTITVDGVKTYFNLGLDGDTSGGYSSSDFLYEYSFVNAQSVSVELCPTQIINNSCDWFSVEIREQNNVGIYDSSMLVVPDSFGTSITPILNCAEAEYTAK